jgi:hypothetical protein
VAHGAADPLTMQEALLAQLQASTQQVGAVGIAAAGGIGIAAGSNEGGSNKRFALPAPTSGRGGSTASARAASPHERQPLPKSSLAAAASLGQQLTDRHLLLPAAELSRPSWASAAATGVPVAVHAAGAASRPALQPVIALAVRHLETLLTLTPELVLAALQGVEQAIALQGVSEQVVASHAAATAAVRALVELHRRAPTHAPGEVSVQQRQRQGGANGDTALATAQALLQQLDDQ